MKTIKTIWWISLGIKLILAALIPLSADEAYYWVWSQNLQLSYFDHPPFVAWLFTLGDIFSSFGHAVRWPSVIMGHLTILFWLLLLKPHLNFEKLKSFLWLFLLAPLLGFGSLIVTPDIPVLFFWSASLWAFTEALRTRKTLPYALLGMFLGLGFCSKYHIVLFVPTLIAYLSFDKKWKQVKISGVVITIVLGLVFSLPVILWNLQNDFASFTFQIKHGLEKSNYKFSWTSSYLLGQTLIIFPLILWAALRSKVPAKLTWLKYFAWAPLIFFFLTSFRALVEANWPIIAYPAVLALAVFHPKISLFTKIHSWFWGLITALVLCTLFIPQLRNLNEKVSEPYDLQKLAQETLEFDNLYGSSYQMSSSLWYFSKRPVYKLSGISRYDFFDTFKQARPEQGAFHLVLTKGQHLPSWLKENGWTSDLIKTVAPKYEVFKVQK